MVRLSSKEMQRCPKCGGVDIGIAEINKSGWIKVDWCKDCQNVFLGGKYIGRLREFDFRVENAT